MADIGIYLRETANIGRREAESNIGWRAQINTVSAIWGKIIVLLCMILEWQQEN